MKKSKRLQCCAWVVVAHAIIVIAAVSASDANWLTYVVILLGAALLTFMKWFYPESYVPHSHRAPWDGNKKREFLE